ELKSIYQNSYFELFINTSEDEGLPVSIMEAFSYGIPAIATDVGGTSEIVHEGNGLLIEKEIRPIEIAQKIEALFPSTIASKRENAFRTWKNAFNSEAKYNLLVKRLKRIDQQPRFFK